MRRSKNEIFHDGRRRRDEKDDDEGWACDVAERDFILPFYILWLPLHLWWVGVRTDVGQISAMEKLFCFRYQTFCKWLIFKSYIIFSTFFFALSLFSVGSFYQKSSTFFFFVEQALLFAQAIKLFCFTLAHSIFIQQIDSHYEIALRHLGKAQ